MSDQELDASGLNCPLPILRAKKAISAMDAGQTLKIIATDPGSVKDLSLIHISEPTRQLMSSRMQSSA